MTGILEGKRGVILGVANDKSIAWSIAQAAVAQGAEVALTFQGDITEKRVRPLAASISAPLFPCDVTRDEDVASLARSLKDQWGGMDFFVHAIAFSDKNELRGGYIDTTRQNFLNTLDVSCYSFVALSSAFAPLLSSGGSAITLSYYGAVRCVPHYNVMGVAKAALEASVRYLSVDLGQKGVRVNALSAGPIRTLAASGIGGFRYMLKYNALTAPLGRAVETSEVAQGAVYLLSPLASGVTGEVLYVDGGYNTVGVPRDSQEFRALMSS